MNELVDWANDNNGFVMIVLTFVYVVATVVITALTLWSIKVARDGHKLQERLEYSRIRPYVTIGYEVIRRGEGSPHVYVVVKNVGLTAAQDVKITINPIPFYRPMINGKEVKKVPFMFTSSIPSIAPGQEFSDNLGYTSKLYEVMDTLVFRGSITYKNFLGEEFSEPYVIDFESMRSSVPLYREVAKA